MWRVYAICFSIGVAFVTLWNLNHSFKWIEDADSFYGIGIALMIFAGTFYVYKDVASRRLNNRFYILQKIVSGFFLYLSVANLTDELFFNPYIISIKEYITALIALTLIYYANTKRMD